MLWFQFIHYLTKIIDITQSRQRVKQVSFLCSWTNPQTCYKTDQKGVQWWHDMTIFLFCLDLIHMCKISSHNSINSMYWVKQFVRFSQKKWPNYDYRTLIFLLHAVDGNHNVMFPLKVFMIIFCEYKVFYFSVNTV